MTELNPKTQAPTGVQRDSETPLLKKPSFLFIASVSIGVAAILLISFGAFNGVAR